MTWRELLGVFAVQQISKNLHSETARPPASCECPQPIRPAPEMSAAPECPAGASREETLESQGKFGIALAVVHLGFLVGHLAVQWHCASPVEFVSPFFGHFL